MGDLVKCKAVLSKMSQGADLLFLAIPPDFRPRIIPCRPKGTPQREGRPEWEYEERDARLHLTPSLMATDTGFHTDFNWSCDYVLCPNNGGRYEHFYAVNPGIKPA